MPDPDDFEIGQEDDEEIYPDECDCGEDVCVCPQ